MSWPGKGLAQIGPRVSEVVGPQEPGSPSRDSAYAAARQR
jgi:hypothetical protein